MTRAHVIGTGRLGQHLANRLDHLRIEVTRWNRNPGEGIRPLSEWSADDAPEAVFLAVSDDGLNAVATQVLASLPEGTWLVHHAGSVDRTVLGDRPMDTAVLWPPMTFQEDQVPDWETMPLIVDTDNPEIRAWARTLAPHCTDVSGPQRRELHLGAVLLGNLTAGWIGMVEAHFQARGLDASVFNPLVEASVLKALNGQALQHVTGPAARNDRTTLMAQADLLSQTDPAGDLAILHHLLTQRILTHHGHDPLPPLQGTPRRD